MKYEELAVNQMIRSGKDLSETGTVLPIIMSVDTNGTTAVNVFTAAGMPFPSRTLLSAFVIAKDTTAGNIILKHGSNTVFTVAKGTTSAALTGATSLSNATVTKGQACTVESSSAGNATVILIYG